MHFAEKRLLIDYPQNLVTVVEIIKFLAVALEEKNTKILSDFPEVVLISKDTNLRIKADAVGLKAEDYGKDKVSLDNLEKGFREISSNSDEINKVQKDGFIFFKRY